jgi:hypothetical protein
VFAAPKALAIFNGVLSSFLLLTRVRHPGRFPVGEPAASGRWAEMLAKRVTVFAKKQ